MKRIAIKNAEEVRKQILDYFHKSEDLKFAYKLRKILLLLDNKNTNCSEVARIYWGTPQTLVNWIHRLNEDDGSNINVLRDRPKPGGRTHISKLGQQNIKDVLEKMPFQFGIKASKWDGKSLSILLNKEFGIELKIRRCQRMLQKMGIENKRGRHWDNGA